MQFNHQVIIKIKQGLDKEDVYNEILPFVEEMQTIPDTLSASLIKNCYERKGNYDLTLQVALRSEAAFEAYLVHAKHKAFSAAVAPFAEHKVKFDFITH